MHWTLSALLALIFFGVANFLLKYAGVRGVPHLLGVAFVLAVAGAIGAAVLSVNAVGRCGTNFLGSQRLLVLVVAGVFYALGMILMAHAISTGKAGPAVAIASSNVLLVALLAWLVLHEKLGLSELLGVALFIVAVLLLSFKPVG